MVILVEGANILAGGVCRGINMRLTKNRVVYIAVKEVAKKKIRISG